VADLLGDAIDFLVQGAQLGFGFPRSGGCAGSICPTAGQQQRDLGSQDARAKAHVVK
jgi:hypothetical protein